MFKKILVALDGSSHAQQALDTAAQLALRCEAELLLFHAMQLQPLRADFAGVVSKAAHDAYLNIAREQADAILGEGEQQAQALGVQQVQRIAEEGEPGAAMMRAAESAGVDLLVVGTRGLTGLRGLTMGSVAHRVTSAASCPVMVVR